MSQQDEKAEAGGPGLFDPNAPAQAPADKPAKKAPKKAKEAPPAPPAPKDGQLEPPREKAAIALPAAPQGILTMVESLRGMITDPHVDADKAERILAVMERMLDRQAKADFDAHFVLMQSQLPQIMKDGAIVAEGVSKQGKAYNAKSRYAKYETIMRNVLPILHEHGFKLTHEFTPTEGGKTKITAKLSGWGHDDKSCSLEFMPEGTGMKNSAQAIVSATSYGRRVTACAALNLVILEEDDDGKLSGDAATVGEPLSADQLREVLDLAFAVEADMEKFIAYLNKTRPKGHPAIITMNELPASRHKEAIEELNRKEAGRRRAKSDDTFPADR